MKTAFAALAGALVLAGCGGNDTTGASGASVVPSNAVAYAEIDSSLDSSQWERVQELLDRFPSRPQLVEELNEELRSENMTYEDDVEPALGDVVVIAAFEGDDDTGVVLTQPEDSNKFRALVTKLAEGDDVVFAEVDGWQAAAERQSALDALRSGPGSIADDEGFSAALGELPEDPLAFAWARGDLLTSGLGVIPYFASQSDAELDWIAGAVEARENGAALDVVANGPAADDAETYASERVDLAPADALAFVTFKPEAYATQLDQLPEEVRAFVRELEGESAAWVRPGAGTVEVTAVLGAKDPQRAKSALDDLLGGGAGLFLPIRSGVVGDDLVVTTAKSVEAAVREPSESLGESEDLDDAREAAGMPEENAGFLFVNVADALPLLALAGLAGVDLPQKELEDARAIRSIVAWSEPSDDGSNFELFVHIE